MPTTFSAHGSRRTLACCLLVKATLILLAALGITRRDAACVGRRAAPRLARRARRAAARPGAHRVGAAAAARSFPRHRASRRRGNAPVRRRRGADRERATTVRRRVGPHEQRCAGGGSRCCFHSLRRERDITRRCVRDVELADAAARPVGARRARHRRARSAWAALAVRRIVRRARAARDAGVAQSAVRDRRPPRARRSAAAPRAATTSKMPFACGVLAPTIVLPAECESWTLDRRRAVLLHELAHVRRHDLLGHTLGRARLRGVLVPPARLDRGARSCAPRASAPATISRWRAARARPTTPNTCSTSSRRCAAMRPRSVALAMARRKEFEGRMLAILDPELRRVGAEPPAVARR